MLKLGLIINPIAGMGGSVGLKGTDGVLEEAVRRGAVPRAESRAELALRELLPLRDELTVITCPGEMGERVTDALGFRTVVIRETAASPAASTSLAEATEGAAVTASASITVTSATSATVPAESAADASATSSVDTIAAAREMASAGDDQRPDVLLFAGGDGTARNIYEGAGLAVPAIGIPAGVKIHSPVFARSPRAAGELALKWLTGEAKRTDETEVLDINEEDYRNEKIATRLYGYLNVPSDRKLTQCKKEPTPLTEKQAIAAIAAMCVDHMEEDTWYLIGAGTTTRGVMEELGLPNTLIGADLIRNRKLEAADVYGDRILERVGSDRLKIIVTVTGGQGFLFGRGNQQLTPAVIRAAGPENIIIIASPAKLTELRGRSLLVDTGDRELDEALIGYRKVISGYEEWTMCRIERA